MRPEFRACLLNLLFISIHASRMGCDFDAVVLDEASILFQSTHPVWDATKPALRRRFRFRISIHASRMGCDRTYGLSVHLRKTFQSTHPVWDATSLQSKSPTKGTYFNPRIPYGMRPVILPIILRFSYFNPRIPYGMRRLPLPSWTRRWHFNPRIPYGMRR